MLPKTRIKEAGRKAGPKVQNSNVENGGEIFLSEEKANKEAHNGGKGLNSKSDNKSPKI